MKKGKHGHRWFRKLTQEQIDGIDWTRTNVAIAGDLGVSKVMVGLLRKRDGRPKHARSRAKPRRK